MIRISELANLEVINLTNGRTMGFIDDLDLDLQNGRINAVIIPEEGGFWSFLSGETEHVIKWSNIVKIGEDVILVNYQQGGDRRVDRE